MTTSIRKKEDRISIKIGLILANGYNGADRSEDNGILKCTFYEVSNSSIKIGLLS